MLCDRTIDITNVVIIFDLFLCNLLCLSAWCAAVRSIGSAFTHQIIVAALRYQSEIHRNPSVSAIFSFSKPMFQLRSNATAKMSLAIGSGCNVYNLYDERDGCVGVTGDTAASW